MPDEKKSDKPPKETPHVKPEPADPREGKSPPKADAKKR
jgi:hypothetical protein